MPWNASRSRGTPGPPRWRHLPCRDRSGAQSRGWGNDSDGGDDEDGVTFVSPLARGGDAAIDVVASVDGKLSVWIDFNRDGDWADSGEQVFADEHLVAGTNSLAFVVPATAQVESSTFARFRFSTAGGLSFGGDADDGEVEDCEVMVYECEGVPALSAWGTVAMVLLLALAATRRLRRSVWCDA